jgi:CBS domain-containing protein
MGVDEGRGDTMKTVALLLRAKGNDVLAVSPDRPVFEALTVMAEKNVGALLVVEGSRLVGVFSERDYARKVILKGKSSKEIPVREIMSSHVLYVGPQNTIEECMALMTEKRIRHLPVLDEGRLVGVISIGDVVKAVIAEQEFVIDQLQHYITGR